MKTLVIGNTGFMGSYLTKELNRLGYDWMPFDISNGLDICNPDHFNSIHEKIDVVVHMASMTFVPDSYQNPYSFFHINSEGTLNTLEFCRKNKAKLVYISSYVYGIPQYSPIDENHPIDAFNPYCGSKLISESLCHYYNKFWDVPIVILRPFNLYGYGQKSIFLISQIVEQAMQGHIKVKETTPKRDFIHVNDVVDAIIKSIEFQTNGFDIFNVGTGISHSVQDAINIVTSYFEKVVVSSDNIARISEVPDTVANISKIQKAMDWNPKIDLQTGISLMVNQYLSNNKNHE
jgi:UDP-glucose 4-epimerase